MNIHEEIQAILPPGIKIDHEECGIWGYFPKAKNYFIKKKDGGFTSKGLFRRRDIAKYETEFVKTFVEKFAEGQDAEGYYSQTLESLNKGTFPIEKLAVTKKIGKAEKARLRYGKPGDRITSYFGYNPEGKKDVVIEGDYNREFYGKCLKKSYDGVKKVLVS
jgi:DNA polymerase I